jgi:5-(carboxyamino)imidazole ribonucleotide synthase
LNGEEAVLEQFVEFEKEVSVVCARDRRGEFVHYGVIENHHADHILDVSLSHAAVTVKVQEKAVEIGRAIADRCDYVGTLCIEYFLIANDELLINELAPRPHNSGHLTFDACVTSQFEQQLRAVCGLPLGSTEFYWRAAMANLLGGIWTKGQPDWQAALQDKNIKLHLYGKTEPRQGRKMGHLTAMAQSSAAAVEIVRKARSALAGDVPS